MADHIQPKPRRPGDIIPMAIGTAFTHINDCLRRRGIIHGVSVTQTQEGMRFTISRLNQYRMPVDTHITFPDTTAESPLTEMMLANYAIAAGVGRRGESAYHNSRMLTRDTALYWGLDGMYHITGMPDRVVPNSTPAKVAAQTAKGAVLAA